jgi:transcriptional regulator with XRE-family HTH domain
VANEREDIVERLRDVIASHKLKVAKLERLMNRSRGYINDALNGDKRLTVELILEVTGWLNADPQQVFASPHGGDRWPSELSDPNAGTALPASLREASIYFRALVLTLEEKRIVSADDVAARLRRLRGSTA